MIETLAANLPKADPASIEELTRRLAELPPGQPSAFDKGRVQAVLSLCEKDGPRKRRKRQGRLVYEVQVAAPYAE